MKAEGVVCPYCGAPVRITHGKSIDSCEYCGMQIVIEGTASNSSGDNNSTDGNDVADKRTKLKGIDYWMPVGFRTRKIWKMLIAGFSYVLFLYMMFAPYESIYTPVQNFMMGALLLFWVTIIFSWEPIADKLPGLKSSSMSVRFVCKAAYCFFSMLIISFLFLSS